MAKRYIVTGNRGYRGYAPGERFEEDLSEAEESRAVARGAIEAANETGGSVPTDNRPPPEAPAAPEEILSEDELFPGTDEPKE